MRLWPCPSCTVGTNGLGKLRVEALIGHLTTDGLLERNWLKGRGGDAIHVVLCGAGQNLYGHAAPNADLVRPRHCDYAAKQVGNTFEQMRWRKRLVTVYLRDFLRLSSALRSMLNESPRRVAQSHAEGD